MENILNCQSGSKFMGNELNYWCQEQIMKHLEHEKEARYIYSHFNFGEETMYELVKSGDMIGFKKI